MQLLDFGAHVGAKFGIEIGQRLVEQEHLGVAHQRPAHGDALSLPPGKLRRTALEEVRDVQYGGRAFDPFLDDRLRLALHLEREGHVPVNVEVRIKRIVLEHHRDVSILRREFVHHLAVDHDLARRDVLQPRNPAQERALAAAGRPDQHQELLIGNVDVDTMHHLELAKALDHLTQLDLGQPPLPAIAKAFTSQGKQGDALCVTDYKVAAQFSPVETFAAMDRAPSLKRSAAGRRSAGIRDVAMLAGVSTATVSRFFNEPASLRPGMRKRVDDAVRELGYIRHGAARALSLRRSHAIGAIIPTVDNATRANKVTALQKRCRERGYNLLLALSEYDLDLELQQCRNLIEAGVDGLMLEGGLHDPALYALL